MPETAMLRYVASALLPAAWALLPPAMDSPEARALILAIGGQESGFRYRRQIGGPARGLYQFERAGVAGVLGHPATMIHAGFVCTELLYPVSVTAVYDALADNDVLATCVARLLLWTLPSPLPLRHQPDRAWRQYLRCWRPGKPDRERFDPWWDAAWTLVGETL